MKQIASRCFSLTVFLLVFFTLATLFSRTVLACFQDADCNCDEFCTSWFFGSCDNHVGALQPYTCGSGYSCAALTTIWEHSMHAYTDSSWCSESKNNDYYAAPDCSYWRGTTINGYYDQMDPGDWQTTRWLGFNSCTTACGSLCGGSGTYGCESNQSCVGASPGSTDECGCRPNCYDQNGFCALSGHNCPAGYNFQDNTGTNMCNFPNDNNSACCTKTPDCTTGITACNSCGGGEPYNTCGTYWGSQTCQHNTKPNTPVCKNVDFTNGCWYSYDVCDGGSGYSCGSGSVCRKTMGGKITDSETGGALAGVTMASTEGNGITDGSGNFRIGNFGYQQGFNFNPPNAGHPCDQGYICNGAGAGSPNPSGRSGTVGGGGDCGTNCNFTYTPGHIAGHVYIDYNHNGVKDAEDVGIANVTVTANGGHGHSDTTDSNGAYDISYLDDGSHTVTVTVPSGYQGVTTTHTITIGPNNYTTNFFITPLYSITGRVYNDFDSGDCYNPPGVSCDDNTQSPPIHHGPGIDTLYTKSGITVTVTGTGVNQTINSGTGTYTSGQVLESGTYTVSYTNLPDNYHMTYPSGSIPPSFTVTVGTPGTSIPCDTKGYNDDTCDATGNIANLGFGMNNEISWHQGWCTDVRDENSTQDFIPDTPVCGTVSGAYTILGNISCVQGPGIYYSGAVTPDFGFGSANANNWLVGGANAETFTPVNPGVIRTSNSYILTTISDNGLPTYDLSLVCSTSSCYLPDTLPSGIYLSPFNTTFSGTYNTSTHQDISGTYTFPTNKNYVFVIGDSTHSSSATFASKMLVPNGSTATFTTSKNIYIDPSVGQSTITSTAPDLEGFYSADQDFVVESSYVKSNRCNDNGTTKDLRFNLIGSAIANAGGNGGDFINNRDMCAQDLSCPAVSVGNGDDGSNDSGGDSNLGITYILNAPAVIKHKNFFWQELAP